MTFQTLQLRYDSGIAEITLDRAEKRNALSFQLLADLRNAFDEVENSDALVVILTGAGKAFCAGMDLDELKGLTGKSHEQDRKSTRLNSSH